jgi:nucleoside-diphosphate-sugar epimerase
VLLPAGKNLTEKLVASYHKQHGLPVAIVRPSLVTGLAGLPYPGYCGNVAGGEHGKDARVVYTL